MNMKFIWQVGFSRRMQRRKRKRRDRCWKKSKWCGLTVLQEFAAADTDGIAFL